jgi:hypothetical protein
MPKIPIYQSGAEVVAHFLVDASDVAAVKGYKWRFKGGGSEAIITGSRPLLYLRQLLCPAEGLRVIHRNDDPLDWRRENLEWVSNAEMVARIRSGAPVQIPADVTRWLLASPKNVEKVRKLAQKNA